MPARVAEGHECGLDFTSAAYKTSGDTLILEYGSRIWQGPRPMCYCRYELDYVIKGLNRISWNIEVSTRAADRPHKDHPGLVVFSRNLPETVLLLWGAIQER